MKILLTGASGFLGSHIRRQHLNDQVITLGRRSSDVLIDLSRPFASALPSVELVLHCAGKAHSVPKTQEEKQAFFNVNTFGTANLLAGLSQNLPKAFVFISTVAVYGVDKGLSIKESAELAASDPYGLSKIEAEKLVRQWCAEKNVTCTILRLPLLAGSNPPGNLGAMIKGIRTGYYFDIAGGTARKSIVLASDVAKIIPEAAKAGGVFNLTDGCHPSFAELSAYLALKLGRRKPMNMPGWFAKGLGKIGDVIPKFPLNSRKLFKITKDLTFDDSKAMRELGWNPTPVLKGFEPL
ncbi:NAD(P)-dependent oxidoreductase [Pedobacter sp. SYP-B3415]|uniref:NAD-dependent epimerase/dehydratase family protein n=1 Tax=Pedobacter sp. SYP-B3415 TaxID=2496641 RepID=UPI00101C8265|nr:NAD-dependent epimerase/dehydratase family protein [Pedobacter sp. SYP-B3415]